MTMSLIKKYSKVPKWTVDSIKLLICIVYIYAGLAKLNSDWLLNAMPLKIWLTSKYDLPIIGEFLLQKNWVHYLMSWGGMFYDLSIPFLLLYSRTRLIAFVLVVFFHVFTLVLFPIGMFPHIRIFCSTIFFSSSIHEKVLNIIKTFLKNLGLYFKRQKLKQNDQLNIVGQKIIVPILIVFFFLQATIPFRYMAYPGELFWHEQGYRFSWRVMLIEKWDIQTLKLEIQMTAQALWLIAQNFLHHFN